VRTYTLFPDIILSMSFSWEYPNRQGIGCNTISPKDIANFLLFLQVLRQDACDDLLITAAGSLFPWYNETGGQSTDLSPFLEVLDWVTVQVCPALHCLHRVINQSHSELRRLRPLG